MQTLKHFLLESQRTYKLKIKIAGEPEKKLVDLFCYNLQKFDPVDISEPRRSPILATNLDFPEFKDTAITSIDVEFRYPCTEPMIKQIAAMVGINENLVKVTSEKRNEYGEIYTSEQAEQQPANSSDSKALLLSPYSDSASAKQAAKEYGLVDEVLTKRP